MRKTTAISSTSGGYSQARSAAIAAEPKRLAPNFRDLILTHDNVERKFALESRIEENLFLTIRIKPDGELVMQVRVIPPGAVLCRYDRQEHSEKFRDVVTNKPVRGPHKHYHAEGVEGPERRYERGLGHIGFDGSLKSITKAVEDFCLELNIQPPQSVSVSMDPTLEVGE